MLVRAISSASLKAAALRGLYVVTQKRSSRFGKWYETPKPSGCTGPKLACRAKFEVSVDVDSSLLVRVVSVGSSKNADAALYPPSPATLPAVSHEAEPPRDA